MTRLALASLRHRRAGFVAPFLSVFLGSSIVMAFASMLDTGIHSGVSSTDRITLTIIATVVGGWGAIIVASAVATTLAVSARQRAAELALLRSVGATPRQVVTLIMREMAVVAGLGALLAVPVGYGGGHVLLAMLAYTNQVSGGIDYRFGPAALGIGVGVGLVVALAATWITARRSATRAVRDALVQASAGGRRISRFRFWAGVVLVGFGVQSSVLSLTIVDSKNIYDVQMIASEACILAAIGFALLGPVILGRAITLFAPALRAVTGVSGELAVSAVRQRLQQAATPLMPIIVVTSIATGTLYMQAITNSVQHHTTTDDKSVETMNYVVVGMITVFAAVMLVNLLAATISDRRREFAQQRLVGATPRQLLGLVAAESGVLLVVGLVFGTIGGLLTVLPFSLAITDRIVPDASIGIYLGIVAAVVALTAAASLLATRRATRGDAITVLRAAVRT